MPEVYFTEKDEVKAANRMRNLIKRLLAAVLLKNRICLHRIIIIYQALLSCLGKVSGAILNRHGNYNSGIR